MAGRAHISSRKPLARELASRVPTGVAQARLRARLCSISTVRRPGDRIRRRAASAQRDCIGDDRIAPEDGRRTSASPRMRSPPSP